jgi:Tfp pilus assembly protein PilE
MKTSNKAVGLRQQRGISFFSLVIVVAVLAFLGVVGAQVVPTFVEYQAITKAAKKASSESTVQGVRAAFDRASAIDDIKSVSGKDLDVSKNGDAVVVKFAYNREIHLGGPAYLLLKYEGSSTGGK